MTNYLKTGLIYDGNINFSLDNRSFSFAGKQVVIQSEQLKYKIYNYNIGYSGKILLSKVYIEKKHNKIIKNFNLKTENGILTFNKESFKVDKLYGIFQGSDIKINKFKLLDRNKGWLNVNFDYFNNNIKLISLKTSSFHINNNICNITLRKDTANQDYAINLHIIQDKTQFKTYGFIKYKNRVLSGELQNISILKIIKNSKQSSKFDFSYIYILKNILNKLSLNFQTLQINDKKFTNGNIVLIFDKQYPELSIITHFCQFDINLNCGFKKTQAACFSKIALIDEDIRNILPCFIKESNFFITGQTNIMISGSFFGTDFNEIKENSKINGSLSLENGEIINLSGINENFSFFVKLINLADLKISKLKNDSLKFNRIVADVKGDFTSINLKNVQLISPLLKIYSNVNILRQKDNTILAIKGNVEKGIISKKFDIKSKLTR